MASQEGSCGLTVSCEVRLATPGPPGRNGHVSLPVNHSILVWGGYYQEVEHMQECYVPAEDLWLYDAEVNAWYGKWVDTGDVPYGCSGASAVLLGSSLFVFAGHTIQGNINDLYELRMTDWCWTKHEPRGLLPSPRDKFVGWAAHNKLYFFGGYGLPLNSYLNQAGRFIYDMSFHQHRGWNNQLLEYNPNTQQWDNPKSQGTPPLPRAAHCAAQVGNSVYVFGGRHQGERLNDMHELTQHSPNNSSHCWSRVEYRTQPPEGRSWAVLAAMDDQHLLLYGGFSTDSRPLDDTWSFSLPDRQWTLVQLAATLQPRIWHTGCTVSGGALVVFGGCSSNLLQEPAVQPRSVLVMRLSPPSLQQTALEAVLHAEHLTRPSWAQLPADLHNTLLRALKGGYISQLSCVEPQEPEEASDEEEHHHHHACVLS